MLKERRGAGGVFTLGLAKAGTVVVQSDLLDRWSAYHLDPESRQSTLISSYRADQKGMIRDAEDWAKTRFPDAMGLVCLNARWRKDPPSQAQVDLCMKLGIPVPAEATKGEVSVALAGPALF